MSFSEEKLLIFDGACGTTLQTMDIPSNVWDGNEGCNEYLNLTSPETIIELHRRFLEAGAMVIETNTFGASSVVLSEYGLEDRVKEINLAAIAHSIAFQRFALITENPMTSGCSVVMYFLNALTGSCLISARLKIVAANPFSLRSAPI